MSLAANLLLHGTRGNFHPLRLSRSVLKAWWCADDLTAGSVTNWTDRIGGLVMTQGTSAQRPLQAATSFNGAYPGVTFDGVMTNLGITSLGNIPIGSTPGELWCVATLTTIGAAVSIPLAVGIGSAVSRRAQASGTAGSGQVAISDGTTVAVTVPAVPWTSPLIVKGDWSGTVMNGFVNGAPFGSNPTTIATLNTNNTRARIGSSSAAAPANFWNGPVRHVLIVQGVLSTVLRQKMEGWLAWDSGFQSSLPQTHPYQLFRP